MTFYKALHRTLLFAAPFALVAGLVAAAPFLASAYLNQHLARFGITAPLSLSWASAKSIDLRLGAPDAPDVTGTLALTDIAWPPSIALNANATRPTALSPQANKIEAFTLSATGPLEALTLSGTLISLGQTLTFNGTASALSGRSVLDVKGQKLPASALFNALAPALVKQTLAVTAGTLSGTLHLETDNWQPTKTTANMALQGATLQLGRLSLTNTALRFTMTDASTLSIQSLTGQMLGGGFSLAPVTLTLPAPQARTTLSLTGLDLAAALSAFAPEGLSGTGHVSGTVPFTLTPEGRITVHDGQLESLETGQINYRPAQKPAFMSAGGQAAFLGTLFDDFHYTHLQGTLNGTVGDTLTLQIKLAGANPAFYNNRAVAFTLNLSGALLEVLKNGSSGFQLSTSDIADYAKQPHDGKR